MHCKKVRERGTPCSNPPNTRESTEAARIAVLTTAPKISRGQVRYSQGKMAVLSMLIPSLSMLIPSPMRANTVIYAVPSHTSQTWPSVAVPRLPALASRRCHISLVVTEDDVEAAVKAAEDAWADALKARELAEKLSIDAEEAAEAAGMSSEAVADELKASNKFSLRMLSGSSDAMGKSLEATSLLSDAVEAAEEASRLEEIAEAALAASEEAIAQHLLDFPDAE